MCNGTNRIKTRTALDYLSPGRGSHGGPKRKAYRCGFQDRPSMDGEVQERQPPVPNLRKHQLDNWRLSFTSDNARNRYIYAAGISPSPSHVTLRVYALYERRGTRIVAGREELGYESN